MLQLDFLLFLFVIVIQSHERKERFLSVLTTTEFLFLLTELRAELLFDFSCSLSSLQLSEEVKKYFLHQVLSVSAIPMFLPPLHINTNKSLRADVIFFIWVKNYPVNTTTTPSKLKLANENIISGLKILELEARILRIGPGL